MKNQECVTHSQDEKAILGVWVAQWVKPLPSARVMISGSWDRAPIGLSSWQGA